MVFEREPNIVHNTNSINNANKTTVPMWDVKSDTAVPIQKDHNSILWLQLTRCLWGVQCVGNHNRNQPKGVSAYKMSKEANRIVNTIKSSKVDVYTDKIEITNDLKEFLSCANKVIEQLSKLEMSPVVMLVAACDTTDEETKKLIPTMMIGCLIPDKLEYAKQLRGNWMKSSIGSVQYDTTDTQPGTKTTISCFECDKYVIFNYSFALSCFCSKQQPGTIWRLPILHTR